MREERTRCESAHVLRLLEYSVGDGLLEAFDVFVDGAQVLVEHGESVEMALNGTTIFIAQVCYACGRSQLMTDGVKVVWCD